MAPHCARKAKPLPDRIRVIDLETAGMGAREVCEIGWQDVARGDGGVWRLEGEGGAAFVNPGRPIGPDTMSIHHIRDEEVAGAPFWNDAATPILRPEGGVLALAAHRASFEQRFCNPRLCGGARWICTWKCALRLWPGLQSYSNQMLRYQRRPEGLVHEKGLPAHRAFPDAYVTAHHLRDMLNEASVEQLIAWSAEPGLLARVPSGPDRGKPWTALTDAALEALTRDRDVDIRFTATTELRRRSGAPAAPPPAPAQARLL